MNPERRAIANAAKGWLYDDEAECLHRLAVGCYDVVEIGAYCGKSSIWLGDAVEETGFVWSVDPHRGNVEMREGGSCYDADVWTDDRIDTFPLWRRNIEAAGLSGVVLPVVTGSLTFAAAFPTSPDLVFIDGDHGPAVLDDYEAWKSADVIAFHDSPIEDVAMACQLALADGRELVEEVSSLKVFR